MTNSSLTNADGALSTLPDLNRAIDWKGSYNGVRYRLNLHSLDGPRSPFPRGIWCYYLLIHEQQIPPEHKDKFNLPPRILEGFSSPRITHDYDSGFLGDLPWHGGITYYGKLGGLDGEPLIFEMGCDFAHSFDMDRVYTPEQVQQEAKATIDALLERIDLYVRCSWDGCFVPRDEAVSDGRSGFVAKTCETNRSNRGN